jgi:hypothetical protein
VFLTYAGAILRSFCTFFGSLENPNKIQPGFARLIANLFSSPFAHAIVKARSLAKEKGNGTRQLDDIGCKNCSGWQI